MKMARRLRRANLYAIHDFSSAERRRLLNPYLIRHNQHGRFSK
jgi:hypothetical protein